MGKSAATLVDDGQSRVFYAEAAATPGLLNFSADFLGRPIRAGNGVIVGTARDLLVAMRSGAAADLLVTGPASKGAAGAPAPVPWCCVADLQLERAIIITIDPSQLRDARPCAAPGASPPDSRSGAKQ